MKFIILPNLSASHTAPAPINPFYSDLPSGPSLSARYRYTHSAHSLVQQYLLAPSQSSTRRSALSVLPEAAQLQRARRSIFEGLPPDRDRQPIDAAATSTTPISAAVHSRATHLASHLTALQALPLAQAVFAVSYQAIFNSSDTQALQALPELDQALHDAWRNANNAAQVETIWCAQTKKNQDLALMLEGIEVWTSDTPFAPYNANAHSGAVNVGKAQYAVAQNKDHDAHGSQQYWAMLQRASTRVDPQRVSQQNYTPLDLLKAVSAQRNMPLPTLQARPSVLGDYVNVLQDEAALISYQASMLRLPPASLRPYATIRAGFQLGLLNERQDAIIAQNLIPKVLIAPDHATFWYRDGALHNAIGMNVSSICDVLFSTPYQAEPQAKEGQPHAALLGVLAPLSAADFNRLRTEASNPLNMLPLARYPQRPNSAAYGDVWLTHYELTRIVKQHMDALALDQHFPIGSPFHSLASVGMRLASTHQVNFPASDDPLALLANFNTLANAWSADPQFPASPSLTAAFHWAHSNGITLIDLNSGVDDTHITPIKQYFAYAVARDDSAITWLTKKHFSIWDQLPAIAALHAQDMPPLLTRIVKAYTASATGSEAIRYRDESDLRHKLNARFAASLSAYSPLPEFNMDAQIRQYMREHLAMSDEQINTPKLVHLHIPTRPVPIHFNALITPLVEYQFKAIFHIKTMEFEGRTINPLDSASQLKPQFRATLYANPILRAQVYEILRMSGTPYKQTDFDQLLEQQVSALTGIVLATPRANARVALDRFLIGGDIIRQIVEAFLSGEPRQILGLLPFIVPAYDLEEGMRHGNANQAKQGAINLSVDALLCLLSGFAEGAMSAQLTDDAAKLQQATLRLPAHESASVDMIKTLSVKLPSLAADKLSSKRRLLTNSDAFHINRDHSLGAGTFNTLATRARRGETVYFQTPTNDHLPLLYLSEEERVVPVRRQENYAAECDLYGIVTPDAPPIFENTYSTSQARRSKGLPGGSAAIDAATLSKRPTISAVSDYIEKIKDLPDIAKQHTDPATIFDTLFKFSTPSHPMTNRLKGFAFAMYEKSPTMTAIFNYAKKTKSKGSQKTMIHFDEMRACASNSGLCFLSDEMLKTVHYMSPHGPQRFQRERMWLHEMLHKLTGLKDVAKELGDTHRGAIIYLVDRIFDEAGLDSALYPPRISYKKAFYWERTGHAPVMQSEQIAHIGTARDWSIAENIHLDALFDPVTHKTGYDHLQNMYTSSRITVKQARKLKRVLAQLGDKTFELQNMTKMLLDHMHGSTNIPAKKIKQQIQSFAIQSTEFQQLYAHWMARRIRPELEIKFIKLPRIEGHLASYQIAYGKKPILLINSKPVFYHSEHGVKLMSDTRKLTGALLDLMLPDEVANMPHSEHLNNRYLDRTLAVVLENKMMALTDEPSAPRICQALTSRTDSLLQHQSSVTRAAKAEDWLLNKKRPLSLSPR